MPQSNSSRIVELNDNSFVAATKEGKILVYTQDITRYDLLDQVQIDAIEPFEISPTTYGFDQIAYYQANALIGSADDSKLVSFTPNKWMDFFGSGGFNRDPEFRQTMRSVLFQADPLTDFEVLISLGLIYMMIMKAGQYILSFFMDELCASITVLALLSLGAYFFAYPLSLVRVIVSGLLGLFVKDRKDRLILYVLFFLLYNPAALRSLAILYPLLFMVFSAFSVNGISRISFLAYVQIAILHRVALVFAVLYPILRKGMVLLIGALWLGYFIPALTSLILTYHQLFSALMAQCNTIMPISGKLSLPLIITIGSLGYIASILKRQSSWVFLILILFVPLLSAPWAYQVTLISVGQGDATLLQAPFNQEVLLIDTGKSNAYGQLQSFLDAQGIRDINTLIVTHQDNDHSGNVSRIISDYHVMRSVTQATDVNTTWFHLKSLKTALVSPTDNQASLVYLFQLNRIRFLMMADADETTELDLLNQYPNLQADVLKVGHHGSATSTSDDFLSHIRARLALISVGHNNYGHPSAQTLNRLSAHRVSLMMTRDQGDITFILSRFGNALMTSSSQLKVLHLGF